MTDSPDALDHRTPGAALDRRLRMSGQIFPVASGCNDLAIMQRVHAALIASLADPNDASAAQASAWCVGRSDGSTSEIG